jgi:xylulokinase
VSTGLILGLDIGTQAVKANLVTPTGEVLARVDIERGPSHPAPGWVEMDIERDWWGTSVQAVRQILTRSGIQAAEVFAIGVSGLVPCLGLLDEAGRSLRPAILYSDNRALEELDWVNQRGGLELSAEAVVPKLVWIQRHQSEIFARATVLLSAHNYVVYRLTGNCTMDYDTAGIMGGIFDAQNKTWKTGLMEKLGLPAHILPQLSPATGIVGRITSEAARAIGLPEGIPVIAGSGDTFPTIVGCGAVDPGDAMIAFGTTGLLTITNRPLVESAQGPHFESNSQQGSVTWGSNVLSAGRLVRWFSDQFGQAERSIASRLGDNEFTLLEMQAEKIPAGAQGLIVLPHWLGRRTPQPNATLRGSTLGWTPAHSPAHFYRAILEAFAYNVKQGFDVYRSQIQRVVVTSGGARCRLWRQIMADVLDSPLEYHSGSCGALGIAFLTAYATHSVDNFSDIKTRWLAQPEITYPDPQNVAVYRQLFEVYCHFDEALAEPYAHLAQVIRENQL